MYCLRYTAEQKSFLFAVLHSDIEGARVRLAVAGVGDRQNAELVRAVLANVHFYRPDAQDATLDQRCTAEEVERKCVQLGLVSRSLAWRPAFRAIPP